MRFPILISAALFFAGPASLIVAPSHATEIRLPAPELEKLPNGLEVAWFVRDSIPVVDLALVVKSGTRDEPSGKTGVSELLAALIDRGAAGMSAAEISRSVERLGATRAASADDDRFNIGMHGLAPDAPALLDLLAKMATRPDFPEAEVAREHARLLDRWKHIADYGETLASLAFHRLTAAGTEYGRGSFLSVDEFRKVGRDDVVAFHKRHFTPANSVLIIVGRVDRAKFRPLLLEAFGKWEGPVPERSFTKYVDKRLPPSKPRKAGSAELPVVLVDRPGLTQAQIRIGFKAPPFEAPQRYSLAVVNALLGEYFNSRLNSVIRDKLGLTYSIGSGFSHSKSFSRFSVASATRNEMVGKAIRKTVDILREIRRGDISEDEVTMAKEYLLGSYPLGVSTPGAVAARWLSGHVFELGSDYLNEFVPRVRAVSRESVLAASAKDFDLDDLVIVVAGDGAEVLKSLREAGLKSVRRVKPQDLM